MIVIWNWSSRENLFYEWFKLTSWYVSCFGTWCLLSVSASVLESLTMQMFSMSLVHNFGKYILFVCLEKFLLNLLIKSQGAKIFPFTTRFWIFSGLVSELEFVKICMFCMFLFSAELVHDGASASGILIQFVCTTLSSYFMLLLLYLLKVTEMVLKLYSSIQVICVWLHQDHHAMLKITQANRRGTCVTSQLQNSCAP